MIATIKTIIVVAVVIGVGVPSAYYAYTYLNASGTANVLHYIPENATVMVHLQNNTSNYYAFAGVGYAGVIFNYSLNSFSSRAQNLTSNSSGQGQNGGKSISNSVNITFYKSYLGSNIYSVRLTNITSSLGTMLGANLTSLISNGSSIDLYASPIGSSYMVLGNLNGTDYSISANHYGKYSSVGQRLNMHGYQYYSFFANLSDLTRINSTSSQLKNLINSNENFSAIAKDLNTTDFTLYGNLTNSFTNLSITISNVTLLHDISSLVNYRFGKYVVSSSESGNTLTFEFNFGIRNGSISALLKMLMVSPS
ncbi:MAG: hypothetical protein M1375_02750 [Candidatus Thermoplasmatota archaeon]|jgi:hypothetical protein|nr:hypothetical protein [Candidatus Thermoplasmatota archaeon]MCL5790874.1 hypothetical protein [Candidatus Thermoplasmatota archaeon]